MKKNFASQGTLDSNHQCHRARLNGRAELFRDLRRKTVRVLRVDKEEGGVLRVVCCWDYGFR